MIGLGLESASIAFRKVDSLALDNDQGQADNTIKIAVSAEACRFVNHN